MPGLAFISSRVHGLIDYLMGIVLLVTPNVFGYAQQGGPAVWVPRGLGVLVILLALMTDYELGVLHWVSFKLHLVLDFFLTSFLLISPWLFGFSYSPHNVWFPPLFLAVAGLLVILLTLPRYRTATRSA